MRIVAAVQARMGSTRLPGKSMMGIAGQPMARRVVNRVRRARLVDSTVLMIPDSKGNESLQGLGIPFCAGSEDDIVSRLLGTARKFGADAMVRITADCPLIDPEVIDRVVGVYLGQPGLEYVSNSNPLTFPNGLDVEVYPLATLERLDRETEGVWRGWLAPYVWDHGFRRYNVECIPDISGLRWTVDYPEDLVFVRAVYERLGDDFGMWDILELLAQEPALQLINARVTERFHGFEEDERRASELSAR